MLTIRMLLGLPLFIHALLLYWLAEFLHDTGRIFEDAAYKIRGEDWTDRPRPDVQDHSDT